MTDTPAPAPKTPAVIDWLYLLTALFFLLYLMGYYWTARGGPTLLAITLVPVTFILFTLDEVRKNEFYPRLSPAANYAIAAVYIGISIVVAVYVHVEYEDIGTVRAGIYSATDLAIGGVMVALIMEYTRKRYMPLFILNIILILYAVYGWLIPGM
jgi:TRAP-type uncharacterized transport system fused permease subunit